MSNPWAIAAVTETLGQVLGRIATEEPSLGPLKVSFGPPDKARTGSNKEARLLNVFLYRVTPNQGWANQDLPSRAAEGGASGQPVLALDLRYLLTAYGYLDDEKDAQHVLAHAMSLLHDEAVLRRDAIRAALNAAGGPIAAADLDKQVELIRLTPDKLSDEDMVRMWTIFGTSYRISVGYQASVVLIQRPRTFPVAPPAREARVVAVPFRSSAISGLAPTPIGPGDILTISGRALAADAVTVRFGMIDVAPAPADVLDNQVRIALPAGLRAGANTVQVLGSAALPGGETRLFQTSDVAAFVLSPAITTAIPAGGISVARGGTLTLNVSPPVFREQRVLVLIGRTAIERTVTPTAPASTTSLHFAIPPAPFPAGTSLLRVSVDGAETPLVVDTVPGSPTEGQYTGPKVKVT